MVWFGLNSLQWSKIEIKTGTDKTVKARPLVLVHKRSNCFLFDFGRLWSVRDLNGFFCSPLIRNKRLEKDKLLRKQLELTLFTKTNGKSMKKDAHQIIILSNLFGALCL